MHLLGSKAKLFISYRHDDSANITDRIYDHLRKKYRNVFKDVDSIPEGTDFRDAVETALGSSDIVLAIIGSKWLGIKNEDNIRRLDDPEDYVRIEIETALKRKIPVIPVLVGDASMPSVMDLPKSLHDFAFLRYIAVRRDPSFKDDIMRLKKAVGSKLNKTDDSRKQIMIVIIVLTLALFVWVTATDAGSELWSTMWLKIRCLHPNELSRPLDCPIS